METFLIGLVVGLFVQTPLVVLILLELRKAARERDEIERRQSDVAEATANAGDGDDPSRTGKRDMWGNRF